MVVIDLHGALESGSKLQLRFQYLQRPRAQKDPPIFASLRAVSVNASNAGFIDAHRPMFEIDVRQDEGDLLGGRMPVKKRNSS